MKLEEILIKMIKAIDLFQNISDEEALELSKHFKLEIYSKWTTILKQWSKPDNIYLIRNWKLQVTTKKWNETVILWELNAGEIFGEMSYLKSSIASADVVTLIESDIWEIPTTKFTDFLYQNGHIKDDIYAIMQEREKNNISKLQNHKSTNDLTIIL